MTIQIARTEFTAAGLRHRARIASDPDQARRLLAIASILDGASRLLSHVKPCAQVATTPSSLTITPLNP